MIMKTKMNLLFLLLMMTGIFTTNAQRGIFGIRAGANLATISGAGNIYDNSNLNLGSSFAALVGYKLSNAWSLFGELGFEQKGYRDLGNNNSNGSETIRRFDYLTVPIALRGIYPVNDKLSIYGELGPYNAFLVKSKYDETRNGENILSNNSDPNIKANDFGWWIGGGFEIPVAKKKLNLDIRYSRGIMEVDKLNSELRNKSLSLSLGFWF
jgi:hypothetical protein